MAGMSVGSRGEEEFPVGSEHDRGSKSEAEVKVDKKSLDILGEADTSSPESLEGERFTIKQDNDLKTVSFTSVFTHTSSGPIETLKQEREVVSKEFDQLNKNPSRDLAKRMHQLEDHLIQIDQKYGN